MAPREQIHIFIDSNTKTYFKSNANYNSISSVVNEYVPEDYVSHYYTIYEHRAIRSFDDFIDTFYADYTEIPHPINICDSKLYKSGICEENDDDKCDCQTIVHSKYIKVQNIMNNTDITPCAKLNIIETLLESK